MAQQVTQVYIGDLPSQTDEAFLRGLLQDFGTIQDGAVLIKKHRSLDKCFAFVTFDSHENAAKAIQEYNYTKLDGTPIRMSWADAETKRIRQSGKGNLFIHGLDESIEVSQLHEAFSNFGEIISCKIPQTKGKSNGYGYIQFRNPEDAERARQDLAEASINGKQITIETYNKPAKKSVDETFTNVFIKPLPADIIMTEEDIKEILSQFGEIQSIKLVKDKDGNPFIDRRDGKQKVFCFCNFRNHDDAVKATQELKEFKENEITCCRAMTRNERSIFLQKQSAEFRRMKNKETQGRNMFVKGFSEAVTEDEFKEAFSKYGEIENAKIKFDPATGVSLKSGYVLFKTIEAANECMSHSLEITLQGEKVYVAIFKPREERKRDLAKRARNTEAKKYAAQIQSPMNGISTEAMPMPMPMPGQPQMQMFNYEPTSKDIIKEKLHQNGIAGIELKKKISSISEEQAKALLQNEEKLEQWIQLP
jgi:polyadenylate-binding protein